MERRERNQYLSQLLVKNTRSRLLYFLGRQFREKLFFFIVIFLTTYLIAFSLTHSLFAMDMITTVAGNGVFGYSGDGGNATSAQLYNPEGVAIDSSGNLYIADQRNHRIRKVSPARIITTIAGNGIAGYSGDGGSATSAQLSNPLGVAIDSSGNLYITDTGNHRVRKVSPSGIITTIAGTGVSGYSGDGGEATSAQLYVPRGIAIDSSGNLYIADQWNHRIRKITPAEIITTVAGTGTSGYSGDGGSATLARLYNPVGVAIDSSGNLYIGDGSNGRVRKISPSGIITTVAGNGIWGYSGDGGSATSAQLNYPTGVVIDSSGNLYIADTYNNRIRRVDTSGIITTVAGNGIAGYSGDGGSATSAQFYYPFGVATDSSGNLYIGDYYNHRIRKILFSGVGVIAGKVTKTDGVTPISGAVVEVLSGGIVKSSTTTDTNGNYSITLGTGTYWVFISSIGYIAKLNKNVSVTGGETTTLDISLETGDPNLVGYWKFDEGEGNIAFDYSGYKNNGTIKGANWTTGIINGALNFDGVDDYIDIADSDNLDIINAITISAWIKPNTYSYIKWVVSKANAYHLGLDSDSYLNHIRFELRTTPTGSIYSRSNGTVNLNEWNHIAVSANNTYNNFYINGILDRSIPGFTVYGVSNSNLAIGGLIFFSGKIDEVKIYNYAQTVGQIAEEAQVNRGVIAGKVTKSDGVTEIAGATIEALLGYSVIASVVTDAGGNYSITVATGTYDVRASASGYVDKQVSGVVIAAGSTTTVNFVLSEAEVITQPDLIIQSLTPSTTVPVQNQTVSVAIMVKNQGDGAVTIPFFVDFYKNLTQPPVLGEIGDGRQSISFLAAGSTASFNTSFLYEGGTYNLYAQVDTENNISESNENNNTYGPVIVKEIIGTGKVSSEGILYGLVTKTDGVTPIPGAWVGVLREGTTVTYQNTTIIGNYRFVLSTGTYQVKCEAFGYKTLTYTNVVVLGNETTMVNFKLELKSTPPEPVADLSVIPLDNAKVYLSWTPSVSENVSTYRIYYTAAPLDLGTLYSVIQDTVTHPNHDWTSPQFVCGQTYFFSVRPVNSSGIENLDLNNIVSVTIVEKVSGVKAVIKVPQTGKKVSGNCLTIVAELMEGLEASKVLFQYKPIHLTEWKNIPAAGTRHLNPDTSHPYFIHWDLDGTIDTEDFDTDGNTTESLPDGNYDLRAVAYDMSNSPDSAPLSITISLNRVDYDVAEVVEAGQHKKKEKVDNRKENRVRTGGIEENLTEVIISSGALPQTIDRVVVNLNPPLPAFVPLPGLVSVKARDISLESQTKVLNGVVTLVIPYEDKNKDGIIDDGVLEEKNLEVWSYEETTGKWKKEENIKVDTVSKKVEIKTKHLSLFTLFASTVKPDSKEVKVYPNPYKPSKGHTKIIFDKLSANVTIRIFTITGELVWEKENITGSEEWLAVNKDNEKVASGIYIYLITDTTGDKTTGKLAVIK